MKGAACNARSFSNGSKRECQSDAAPSLCWMRAGFQHACIHGCDQVLAVVLEHRKAAVNQIRPEDERNLSKKDEKRCNMPHSCKAPKGAFAMLLHACCSAACASWQLQVLTSTLPPAAATAAVGVQQTTTTTQERPIIHSPCNQAGKAWSSPANLGTTQ